MSLALIHLIAARSLRMAEKKGSGVSKERLQIVEDGRAVHLMKKCELKPSGKGTAATAFGEVEA